MKTFGSHASEGVLGVEFTERRLSLAFAAIGGSAPVEWREVIVPDGAIVASEIRNPKAVGGLIREALAGGTQPISRCVVAVPDAVARIEIVPYLRLSATQRMNAARTAAKKYFPEAAASKKAIDVTLTPIGDPMHAEYLVAYIKAAVKRSVVATMRAAGLREIAIERESIAWRSVIAEDAVLVVTSDLVKLFVFFHPAGAVWAWNRNEDIDIFERVDLAIKNLRIKSHFVNSVAVVGNLSAGDVKKLAVSLGARVTAIDDAQGSPWRLAFAAAATDWSDRVRSADNVA